MIKGNRVQAVNSVAVGPYSGALKTAVGLLTVPTGKTFVLTDLVCGFTPSGVMSNVAVPPGIALLDVAYGQAATAFTAGEIKAIYRAPLGRTITTATTAAGGETYLAGPLVVTNIENGPEFSTCVSAGGVGTLTVPTFGLWIAGVYR
jgi:hypothetical protein